VSAEGGSDQAPLFTPRTGVLLALVGIFAFSALLLLATYASDLENGDDGGGHALSSSALGFSGLDAALRSLGEPVLVSRHAPLGGRHAGLLIETPPPTANDSDVTPMGFGGPVLVVLPKWLARPDPSHKGWVRDITPLPNLLLGPATLVARTRPARRPGVARPHLIGVGPLAGLTPLDPGPVRTFQSMDLSHWKGWTPVLLDERGATVMARAPYGPVYLLSDPDLMNNAGLKSSATFVAAVTLVNTLRRDDGPVIFDVTLNGLGQQRSALRLLFDPPFLAVTLCLAAAAALAGYQSLCRFGPVRVVPRAVAIGKQALADNTAALVRLAGREARMAAPYADLTRDLAARAVGAPRGLSALALGDFLDRLAHRRGAAVTLAALAEEARQVADRARLLDVATRLYDWRVRMTGEG
jgi:hypothetical protein